MQNIENDGNAATLSIDIYSESLAHANRSEFYPEAKAVAPHPKRGGKAA
jgi:hypothetical protein